MSYVIQNFYDFNKKIALTPRFKSIFFYNNLNKFFIFIKLNTFFYLNKKFNFFYLNYFPLFFKYFFSKQFFKIFNKNNISIMSNYDNNLTKSTIYKVYFNFYLFFKNISFKNSPILSKKTILYNLYFLPIKILNIKLNTIFFKNIFFFLLINNFFIWFQNTNNFKFYLNFIFVNYFWKISRFYSTHFLRIYNY